MKIGKSVVASHATTYTIEYKRKYAKYDISTGLNNLCVEQFDSFTKTI